MLSLADLQHWIDQCLTPSSFKDYAPNGLQVQGAEHIQRIVTGVTANQALIDYAIATRAQAIIVHHAWFWRNEDPRIIGMKYQRLASLIKHDISLLGYHLPLDCHPSLGNNAQLADVLGIRVKRDEQGLPITADKDQLIWLGTPLQSCTQGEWVQHVAKTLQRQPIFVGNPQQKLGTIAWCTGGAQSFFDEAISAGIDLFLTGEASEKNCHTAREMQVGFIAAGHHATERYGIQALGRAIAQQFVVDVEFFDVDNPI